MDHQQSTSADSGTTFVKCLSCAKLVRLPADPDPNAIVRCPRCDETYPIGVLLDSEIPELEIVGASAADTDNTPTEEKVEIKTDEFKRFVVPAALSNGAKRRSSRSRSSDSSQSRTSSRSSSSGESSSRSSSRSSGRSSSRSRSIAPKEQNMGFEIFKIVLGALMAPPVAQLVIWWGLGLDPLNFGPTVSKAVPQIVPSKFHDPQAEEDLGSSDSDSN